MSRPLTDLHIHRFRGLRDLKLEGLGDVNLFVGGNNSGKTTILEAVSTYVRPLDLHEWLAVVRRRQGKLIEGIRWLFAPDAPTADRDPAGSNRVCATGSFPVRELSVAYRQIHGISTGSQAEEENVRGEFFEEASMPRTGAQLRFCARTPELPALTQDLEIWDNMLYVGNFPGPTLPATTITPYAHRTEQTPIAKASQAIGEGWKAKVVELLRRLDESVVGFEILAPSGYSPQLVLTHSSWGNMPAEVFGDGIRRVLTFALSIPATSGGVLLVDEIENSVHTLALTRVFSWLVTACREHRIQLFATTHSAEAVDAMLATPEAGQSLVAYRLANNTAQRFDGETLHHLRHDRGLDIRWR
jgi:hypothetical protein